MTRWTQFGTWLVVGCMAITLVGCGGGGLSTAPVSGSLTIDDKPAEGVMVTLVPMDASNKETASGQVQGGKFTVYTGIDGKPGALPGKYKVVLSAMAPSGDAAAAAYKREEGGRSSSAPQVKAPFPDKYLSAQTTDQEVEVKSGSNDLKIAIKSE